VRPVSRVTSSSAASPPCWSTRYRVAASCIFTPCRAFDSADCWCSESGRSIRPSARGKVPLARARYCLRAPPRVNTSVKCTIAGRRFATTMTPEVSRSSRCAGLAEKPLRSALGPRWARTRSTSVPPAIPLPGWTASPDGLSTAIIQSSSWRIRSRATSSGAGARGATGTSPSKARSSPRMVSRSPSASGCSGRARRPFTRTFLVRIIFWRWLAGTRGRRWRRTLSSRTPAWSLSMRISSIFLGRWMEAHR